MPVPKLKVLFAKPSLTRPSGVLFRLVEKPSARAMRVRKQSSKEAISFGRSLGRTIRTLDDETTAKEIADSAAIMLGHKRQWRTEKATKGMATVVAPNAVEEARHFIYKGMNDTAGLHGPRFWRKR